MHLISYKSRNEQVGSGTAAASQRLAAARASCAPRPVPGQDIAWGIFEGAGERGRTNGVLRAGPRSSPEPAPVSGSASPRLSSSPGSGRGPPSRGRRSPRCYPARGKGRVGAGTPSPPGASALPGAALPGPSVRGAQPCPWRAGAAPSARQHLRGGGRGGAPLGPAPLHLQSAAPPRAARRHQSAPASRLSPLPPTPFAQAAPFPQWVGALAPRDPREPDVTRQRKWRRRRGIAPRRRDYPRAAARRRPPPPAGARRAARSRGASPAAARGSCGRRAAAAGSSALTGDGSSCAKCGAWSWTGCPRRPSSSPPPRPPPPPLRSPPRRCCSTTCPGRRAPAPPARLPLPAAAPSFWSRCRRGARRGRTPPRSGGWSRPPPRGEGVPGWGTRGARRWFVAGDSGGVAVPAGRARGGLLCFAPHRGRPDAAWPLAGSGCGGGGSRPRSAGLGRGGQPSAVAFPRGAGAPGAWVRDGRPPGRTGLSRRSPAAVSGSNRAGAKPRGVAGAFAEGTFVFNFCPSPERL